MFHVSEGLFPPAAMVVGTLELALLSPQVGLTLFKARLLKAGWGYFYQGHGWFLMMGRNGWCDTDFSMGYLHPSCPIAAGRGALL